MKNRKIILMVWLLSVCFASGCSKKQTTITNHMTQTERDSVHAGELTLLDTAYEYPWSYDKEAIHAMKNDIKEITFYDEELDSNFVVHLALPPEYDKTKAYPAFVLTDAVWRFGDLPTYRQMMEKKETENVYVVTIGFDPNVDNASDIRGYYFNEKKKEFLDFITDNVMPYLAESYKIDFERSTLFGHSNAGAFAHYAAFCSDAYENQPFHYYIIGSPAFWSPRFLPFQEEPGDYLREYGYFERNKMMDKQLYLCAGKFEDAEFEEYYGTNDTALESMTHLTERLDAYGFYNYEYELYNSGHSDYVDDMLKNTFVRFYGI